MVDLPPLSEGKKGLPLRAKLDAKSRSHVGGGSPNSGPGSLLKAMETTSSSPPPGGSPTLGLARR
jgi:hypothetical protein